jgi:hypothetical protein
MLRIPRERFLPFDLTDPFTTDQHFDLAMSFEVAEHLPASRAAGFVASLVALAPAVLFSAAIPGQGGTGHINEQWPEYWVTLFGDRGYEVIDTLRPKVWNVTALAACLRQNVLLFASSDLIASSPKLAEARAATDLGRLAVVHPEVFADMTNPGRMSLRQAVGALPAVTSGALRRRLVSRR